MKPLLLYMAFLVCDTEGNCLGHQTPLMEPSLCEELVKQAPDSTEEGLLVWKRCLTEDSKVPIKIEQLMKRKPEQ